MGRLSLAVLVLLAAPGTAWGQTPAASPGKAPGAALRSHPAKTAAAKGAPTGADNDNAAGTGAAGTAKRDSSSGAPGSPDASDGKSGTSKASPPSYYYVDPSTPAPSPSDEPPGAPAAGPASAPGNLPPPPGYGPDLIYEPPPPPRPHHVAPRRSLWVGARVGWFVPFGSLWGTCTQVVSGQCQLYKGTKWSAYASSGPMFEVDAGARLGRNYNVFALWEHASLGNGSAEPNAHGGQTGGSTDYYAIGARVSSNPDTIGFLTEVDLGYRRFHATWNDGSELQLTNAPFEFRLGLGADIRVSRSLSISPMLTIGAGGFSSVNRLNSKRMKEAVSPPADETAGHAWATLQLGGHFDIAGSSD